MNLTPSQTIGPFFGHALPYKDGPYAVPPGTADGFWLRGRVLDGAGDPVPDALIETWQVGPEAFGRCPTEPDGTWGVFTVRPGGPGHIAMSVFARGLLDRLVTRVYFEPPALDGLTGARLATLIAQPTEDGYAFDIRLQGENETAFLSL